jgi:hypothetical protein
MLQSKGYHLLLPMLRDRFQDLLTTGFLTASPLTGRLGLSTMRIVFIFSLCVSLRWSLQPRKGFTEIGGAVSI